MPSKKENFQKYLNDYFIETGSYMGDGIQQALDAGYKNIISIELSDKYHSISTNRFVSNPNVSTKSLDRRSFLYLTIEYFSFALVEY